MWLLGRVGRNGSITYICMWLCVCVFLCACLHLCMNARVCVFDCVYVMCVSLIGSRPCAVKMPGRLLEIIRIPVLTSKL